MSKTLTGSALKIAPAIIPAGGTLLLFAYLLRRFPYDGLYGIDSYTYYYQARALWNEATGVIPSAYELFSADGLQHWPVGYHLHIILGFLLSGVNPTGGRLLTILLAALCPVLLYLIVQRLLGGSLAGRWLAVIAGLAAGALLPLNATFTRMGLSLMSDVPTCFWALLSAFCFVRAAPLLGAVEAESHVTPPWRAGTFALGGFALGVAVLIRYGSILLVAPILVYLALASFRRRTKDEGRTLDEKSALSLDKSPVLAALWSVPPFLVALVPQVLYLLTHNPGTGAGDFLGSINLSNMFSTTTYSPDGVMTYDYPMIVFFLLGPLWLAPAGFYSALFVPALALGAAYLLTHNKVRVLIFLLSWWVIPALCYSATPYQAHRFALIYLPAIAILIGCGVGYAAIMLLRAIPRSTASTEVRPLTANPVWTRVSGGFALLVFIGGTYQCWSSVRNWVATHAAWQAEDRRTVAFVEQAVPATSPSTEPPRVVTLGFSAPLYHDTQWPVLELYNADENALRDFLSGPQPHMAVVPEASLAGQWADTPTGERWRWLTSHYSLERKGVEGAYTVFVIHGR